MRAIIGRLFLLVTMFIVGFSAFMWHRYVDESDAFDRVAHYTWIQLYQTDCGDKDCFSLGERVKTRNRMFEAVHQREGALNQASYWKIVAFTAAPSALLAWFLGNWILFGRLKKQE